MKIISLLFFMIIGLSVNGQSCFPDSTITTREWSTDKEVYERVSDTTWSLNKYTRQWNSTEYLLRSTDSIENGLLLKSVSGRLEYNYKYDSIGRIVERDRYVDGSLYDKYSYSYISTEFIKSKTTKWFDAQLELLDESTRYYEYDSLARLIVDYSYSWHFGGLTIESRMKRDFINDSTYYETNIEWYDGVERRYSKRHIFTEPIATYGDTTMRRIRGHVYDRDDDLLRKFVDVVVRWRKKGRSRGEIYYINQTNYTIAYNDTLTTVDSTLLHSTSGTTPRPGFYKEWRDHVHTDKNVSKEVKSRKYKNDCIQEAVIWNNSSGTMEKYSHKTFYYPNTTSVVVTKAEENKRRVITSLDSNLNYFTIDGRGIFSEPHTSMLLVQVGENSSQIVLYIRN